MDILISEDLQSPAIDALAKKYRVTFSPTLWQQPENLKLLIAEARAILVRNQTRLGASVLNCAPKLLGIGRIGVGLDNIDMGTATRLGMVVVAPLNTNVVSVAELTLGLMLSLARKIPRGDRTTKNGGWDRTGCTGMELMGKSVAICGLGRVGRMVATRASAFGMKIRAYDPFIESTSPLVQDVGATLFQSLNEALSAADFVTVHLPLNGSTQHLFNGTAFAAMKPGAFFINTSRGGVMSETDLLKALAIGQVGGAGLDVREVEPPTARTAFDAMDNVILTPHIGAFTTEAQTRTYEAVAADIDRLLSGEPAINFVNQARARR